MIQTDFSIDEGDDVTPADLARLEPYRTPNGVVIDAIRAAQLIHQCVQLLLSPSLILSFLQGIVHISAKALCAHPESSFISRILIASSVFYRCQPTVQFERISS